MRSEDLNKESKIIDLAIDPFFKDINIPVALLIQNTMARGMYTVVYVFSKKNQSKPKQNKTNKTENLNVLQVRKRNTE